MSWEAFRFADPAWLWLGLLGPLVVLLAILRERTAPAIVFPGAARLSGRRGGVRVALRRLPVVLAALGLKVLRRSGDRQPVAD